MRTYYNKYLLFIINVINFSSIKDEEENSMEEYSLFSSQTVFQTHTRNKKNKKNCHLCLALYQTEQNLVNIKADWLFPLGRLAQNNLSPSICSCTVLN